MTPVMLAEYVPADFDTQQRQTSEEALAIVARANRASMLRASSAAVRQGGIYSRDPRGGRGDQGRPDRHDIAPAGDADLFSRPPMPAMWCATRKCSVLVVRQLGRNYSGTDPGPSVSKAATSAAIDRTCRSAALFRRTKPADLPGKERGENRPENKAPANSPVAIARTRSPDIAIATSAREGDAHGIEFRPDAADQRGPGSRIFHALIATA